MPYRIYLIAMRLTFLSLPPQNTNYSQKKPAKALSKCGNEETLARLTAFLDTTQTLPVVKDEALLAQLEDIDGIDGGEKFLFAAAVETENPLLITGDKRALKALLEHQDQLPTVFSVLQNAVITFESAILLAMHKFGFAIVKQKLLGSPKPDGMLRLVLKSETGEADFVEGLCSFSKEILIVPDYGEGLNLTCI
jgi:hypothetical protein